MAACAVEVRRAPRVWWLTLNDPKTRNALTTPVLNDLAATLREADERQIGCVVFSGTDRHFASGADLRELVERSAIDLFCGDRLRAWDSIFATRTPLVASVAGAALGGGFELAMACDLIVAGAEARFGLPETSLGLIPGAGGTQRLTRTTGKALAMDVVLAGRMLKADEAARHGIISRVVAQDQLEETTEAIVSSIAQRSALAIRLAKEAVLAAVGRGSGLEANIELERHKFLLALESEEAREGMREFLSKRARTGARS